MPAELEELQRTTDEFIQRIHQLLPRLAIADLHRLIRWIEWLVEISDDQVLRFAADDHPQPPPPGDPDNNKNDAHSTQI